MAVTPMSNVITKVISGGDCGGSKNERGNKLEGFYILLLSPWKKSLVRGGVGNLAIENVLWRYDGRARG